MSPRRRQQSRARGRRPGQTAPQQHVAEQALDDAARRLLTAHDLAALRILAERYREACQRADQQAQEQPSPDALRHYRAAQRALAEAERALAILETGPPLGSHL